MGDHTYKRLWVGTYTSSAGVQIERDSRQWNVYLPARWRRGPAITPDIIRPTLREAKADADILLRNMIETARVEALAEQNIRLADEADAPTRGAREALRRVLAAIDAHEIGAPPLLYPDAAAAVMRVAADLGVEL